MAVNPHEIVVLGGNFAGLGATHFLLRYTIPALQRIDPNTSFNVTLVTPNTHLFFKPAAPRSLIQPNLIPESKLWRSLDNSLERYSSNQVTLVQGVATVVDPATRTISISPIQSGGGGLENRTIPYNTLLIATGTTSSSLWSLHDKQSLTSETWKAVRLELAKAKTVLIAGGGAVGVETAGEIATAYPDLEIILVSGGHRLLERAAPKTGARAQEYLEKKFKHVKVIHDVRMASTSQDASGKTIIELSDGSTRRTDLYIDATGGVPNSKFLPQDWLDETKRVIVTGDDFRVQGNGRDNVERIYAVGDIVAGSSNSLMVLHAMVPTVCSSVAVDIANYLKASESDIPKPKPFKPLKGTMMVPLGPNGGVGQLFGWQVPSWFVWWAKARTFLTEMIDPLMAGSHFKP